MCTGVERKAWPQGQVRSILGRREEWREERGWWRQDVSRDRMSVETGCFDPASEGRMNARCADVQMCRCADLQIHSRSTHPHPHLYFSTPTSTFTSPPLLLLLHLSTPLYTSLHLSTHLSPPLHPPLHLSTSLSTSPPNANREYHNFRSILGTPRSSAPQQQNKNKALGDTAAFCPQPWLWPAAALAISVSAYTPVRHHRLRMFFLPPTPVPSDPR